MESVSGTAVKVAQNPKAYDMLLADLPIVGQLQAGGFVATPNFDAMPNIKGVDPRFTKQYPHGAPTDYGKVGIGYNSKLVKTPPKSWAEFWDMAPDYKGKIVAYDLDRDIIGSALIYLGYSTNTKNPDELNKAKDALIELKKYLKAFKAVDIARSSSTGERGARHHQRLRRRAAQTQSKDIEWVVPVGGDERLPRGLDRCEAESSTSTSSTPSPTSTSTRRTTRPSSTRPGRRTWSPAPSSG